MAENLLSFDQKFWIRVAARADTADKVRKQKRKRERLFLFPFFFFLKNHHFFKPNKNKKQKQAGKERLSSLARAVMQIVEAVVQQTDRQLSSAGEALQAVLAAGADRKTGEWELPLSTEALLRMRAELNRQYEGKRDAGGGASAASSGSSAAAASSRGLDEEAFLSNAFSWMRKAADDGKPGLVEILQKALQLYASRALSASSSAAAASSGAAMDPSEEVLNGVIAADEREWDFLLSQASASGAVSAAGFAAAVRRRMEGVALGLASGSYAQRVQAEFLKEVEERGEEVLSGKKN